MTLILQIETATASCSVALARDGKVLAIKEVNERNVHAEVITRFIEAVIKETGFKFKDLDAIAVSSGPGSYTGLRIGISTAKGLCYALDKPLIAVDTLTAMAYGALKRGELITDGLLLCPMIDARRMEVYTAIFDTKLVQLKPTAAEIVDETSFSDLLENRQVLFFGDGAEKCRAVLGNSPNAIFLSEFVNSAEFLTPLALEKFNAGSSFENVALFEPFYLKDFIAGKKKAE